jgi:hypothetical protein
LLNPHVNWFVVRRANLRPSFLPSAEQFHHFLFSLSHEYYIRGALNFSTISCRNKEASA